MLSQTAVTKSGVVLMSSQLSLACLEYHALYASSQTGISTLLCGPSTANGNMFGQRHHVQMQFQAAALVASLAAFHAPSAVHANSCYCLKTTSPWHIALSLTRKPQHIWCSARRCLNAVLCCYLVLSLMLQHALWRCKRW